MTPSAQQLDDLIGLIAELLVREIENEGIAAANPGRNQQRQGRDHERSNTTVPDPVAK